MTLKNPPKPLPALDRLNEILRYEPETGKLYWRVRRGGKAIVGAPAFTSLDGDGYHQGKVDGDRLFAHRIIWKMVHGSDPAHIDHLDGNPKNNRIENLRSVNPTANHRNRRLSSKNKSGFCGVSAHGKRWRAAVTMNGKTKVLGDFPTIEEAAAARKAAEVLLGYGPSHGRASQ